jgi:HlyD family type I secretion membrane fusion protein
MTGRLLAIADYAQPGRPALIGLMAIGCFTGALVLWGTVAPVSGAAIANGNLQVEGKRQTVQHPYGGVVRRLLVREGEQVERGQVLLTLFDSDPRAKLDVLIAENDAALAQKGRLVAERDGWPEPKFEKDIEARMAEPSVADAVANEKAMMAARARQYQNEKDVQRQRIAQSREQIEGIRIQIKGNDRQEELLKEELKDAETLLEKALIQKTRVLALRRDVARLQAERGARQADIARLQEEIAQTNLEIAKIDRTRTTEITDQLRTVQAKLAELRPKLDAARDVVERTEIRAPATGSVVGLNVFTEAGVIQPGEKLLDIVPLANPLMVEARLRLNDVNEVVPGRRADVRLTSINHAERPTINGTVQTVSADRLTDKESGEGYYALQVVLNADDVRKSRIDLQPGMPAEVIVTTRPRTLFEYLISPLRDEISGAFRER